MAFDLDDEELKATRKMQGLDDGGNKKAEVNKHGREKEEE